VGFAATQVIARASEDLDVIMACRSLDKAKSAMSEIKSAGIKGRLSTVQLDVTDENSIENVAAFVQEKFGRLDVLVNNAAIGSTDPDPRTRIRLCMDTNVLGPILVSAAFRPLLLKSQRPYSIYVSSGVGSLTLAAESTKKIYEPPNAEAYRASKAVLNMVMVLDWKDNKPTALKVFGMCPGFVVSNIRGPSEEARTRQGQAGDPRVSGETLLSIIQSSALLGLDWIGSMGRIQSNAGKFTGAPGAPKQSSYLK
jgi:NAD(P)-dependent dehydrogenase (short-subunit alcohol dehydrogenase family)